MSVVKEYNYKLFLNWWVYDSLTCRKSLIPISVIQIGTYLDFSTQTFTYLSPQNDLNGLVSLIKTFHYQYTLQSQCI